MLLQLRLLLVLHALAACGSARLSAATVGLADEPHASCGTAVSQAEFDETSYALCRADAVCSERFFMADGASDEPRAYDHERFVHLLHEFLMRDADALPFLLEHCHCGNETRVVWLALLRRAEFCMPNEAYETEHGCACLPGRTCDARSTDRQSLDMGVSEAVITLFFALMLYATAELTGLVRRLTKHFLKAESWMQSVHELARNPLAEAAAAAAAAPASGKQSVQSGVTPWTYGEGDGGSLGLEPSFVPLYRD